MMAVLKNETVPASASRPLASYIREQSILTIVRVEKVA